MIHLLISSVGTVKRIDVIPYHDFGSVKYAKLGREYNMEGVAPLPDERIKEIAEMLRKTGIPVQIGG